MIQYNKNYLPEIEREEIKRKPSLFGIWIFLCIVFWIVIWMVIK